MLKEDSSVLGVVEGQLHKPCACPCSAGIALMMWNTFLVKRFSAATYLVDKVRSCLCVCVRARAHALVYEGINKAKDLHLHV